MNLEGLKKLLSDLSVPSDAIEKALDFLIAEFPQSAGIVAHAKAVTEKAEADLAAASQEVASLSGKLTAALQKIADLESALLNATKKPAAPPQNPPAPPAA